MDEWIEKFLSEQTEDDFINTGTTAKRCFEVLHKNGNHVDGLIWAKW